MLYTMNYGIAFKKSAKNKEVTMGKGQWLLDVGQQAAGGVLGAGLGLMLEGHNDRRQLEQQRKLAGMQAAAEIQVGKAMGDYNLKNAKDMWEYTGYGGQKRQIEEAGLNSALMYGMKGGGGITTGPTTGAGSITGGNAPTGGGEAIGVMGMGMQIGLMRAQKELLEAQRDAVKSEIPVNAARERDLTGSAEGRGLANAFTAWMQGTTPEGTDAPTIDKSTRGQKEVQELNKTKAETVFKMDENDRQKLMNNKVMEEIGQKIALMYKQGLTQDEIYRNLGKEGKLLDAEIEWNKLDISSMSVGKFLTNIIKMLFRPR